MQQGNLPQFLSAKSATTAAAQMRFRAAQVQRSTLKVRNDIHKLKKNLAA
jgi:hypothetical protein